MRPSGPLPLIAERSTPSSAARRLASGDALTSLASGLPATGGAPSAPGLPASGGAPAAPAGAAGVGLVSSAGGEVSAAPGSDWGSDAFAGFALGASVAAG